MSNNIQSIQQTFESEYGKSLSIAINEIKAKMKADEYDNDIRTPKVRLFYTQNPNFEMGNGVGFYFTIKAKPGLSNTFKIK